MLYGAKAAGWLIDSCSGDGCARWIDDWLCEQDWFLQQEEASRSLCWEVNCDLKSTCGQQTVFVENKKVYEMKFLISVMVINVFGFIWKSVLIRDDKPRNTQLPEVPNTYKKTAVTFGTWFSQENWSIAIRLVIFGTQNHGKSINCCINRLAEVLHYL